MSYEVILATYNGERYVRTQVESILAQSVKPSRIIIRDDGSTDKTIAILQALKKESDVDIEIISDGFNLGYIKNFEKLSEYVEAEFVFFSDQDDIWVKNKAETLMAVFSSRNQANVVFSDAYLINNDLQKLGTLWDHIKFKPQSGEIKLEKILLNNIVTGATMAVRRSFLASVMPFPPKIPHDYWLASNACASGSLIPAEEKLILYRQHENNQIGAKKSSLTDKFKAAFDPDKRKKRVVHYREIYDLVHGLNKLQRNNSVNDLSKDILDYLHSVNAIYAGSVFDSEKGKSLLSALMSPSYSKYTTKQTFIRDFLDGIIIRMKLS